MRLDKFLCDCGLGTRSEIKKLIKDGFVKAEGVNKVTPDTKVSEETEVFVKGEKIVYKKYIYLMLNKPKGYVSATFDKHYKTVIDLLPDRYMHYKPFPIGRLDIDTTGLLVLSNDGNLSHMVLSPSRHIDKTYIAKVDGDITEEDIRMFKAGMDLGDFRTKPAILEAVDNRIAKVVIREGKFHQVKRMFEKCGKNVIELKRVAMNELSLDESLTEGEVRELTEDEFYALTKGLNLTKEEVK